MFSRQLVLAASLMLAACGAVGDFIATDPYDIMITNTDRDAQELVIAGGHHDPYTYRLQPGAIVTDTINVQSRQTSGGGYVTGTTYRYADIRVSTRNLRTGTASGPAYGNLHWPGVTGIKVGSGGNNVQISSADPQDGIE